MDHPLHVDIEPQTFHEEPFTGKKGLAYISKLGDFLMFNEIK